MWKTYGKIILPKIIPRKITYSPTYKSVETADMYHYKLHFLYQESTCIQVCPDYSKNPLVASVQIWPFVSHVLD